MHRHRGPALACPPALAPAAIVFEVRSPHTRFGELRRKAAFYERHGAGELYIYDPQRETLEGFLRQDARGQRLLVARVTKAASAALERVGEAMKKLTPGALPEFAMRLALLGETLPIDALELVPVTVVPRRDAWSLRLATRDDGALEAALAYQALAGGPWLVPGEGSTRALAPDGTTALRITDRDVGAELDRVATLWRGWGLPGEVSAVAVLTEHDAALRLVSAVRAEPHGVHVEWTTQPLRVLPRARARNLRLAITAAADWFAVEGELVSDEYKLALAQLLYAARRRSSFVQVADDTWVELEATLLDRLRTLDPHVRAVRHRLEIGALSVPALTEVVTDVAVPDRWSAIAERARRAGDVRPAVPRTLQAELRPYQQEGFAWMARLAAWGAGAVLADDMGLGKTVQAIALLLHRAPEGPAVVVAPTSVTHNWRRELARFAPTLRVRGLRGEDSCDPATLGPGDVLVLSYGVLVLEREALAPVRLASVVYDEAQVIKNPASQRSQAARALTAEWRLALTGTPVENHLGDLWAIMAAVSPGLLGSWEHFRSRWVGVSGPALDGLRRLVQPFVLRRAKSEVLRELPAKTEVVDIELSSAERALYEDARLAAAAALRGLGAELSTGAGRLHVLAALSRLRQLACDASLVVSGEAPPSSKLARLGELTAALLDEGHSVLVFSQFVKLLDRAEAELSRRALPLIRLDGSTPAAARGERVDRFQASGPTVMLVSLRAGGTGLNLTAADYVFHLDPWWNPAVEDQATDRAHRIGQTRPVTVYRMVSRGTIEAAILGLHAEKRGLAAELLEGTGSAQPLSAEDLLALIGDAPDGPSPREPELDEGDDGAGAEDTPSEPPPLSLPPPARRAAPRRVAPEVLAPPAPDVTPAVPWPAPSTPLEPSTPAPSATPPVDAATTAPLAGLDAVIARVRAELSANYATSTAKRYAQVLTRMVEWGQVHGARDAAQVVSLYRAAMDAGQRPASDRVVVRSLAMRLEAP